MYEYVRMTSLQAKDYNFALDGHATYIYALKYNYIYRELLTVVGAGRL